MNPKFRQVLILLYFTSLVNCSSESHPQEDDTSKPASPQPHNNPEIAGPQVPLESKAPETETVKEDTADGSTDDQSANPTNPIETSQPNTKQQNKDESNVLKAAHTPAPDSGRLSSSYVVVNSPSPTSNAPQKEDQPKEDLQEGSSNEDDEDEDGHLSDTGNPSHDIAMRDSTSPDVPQTSDVNVDRNPHKDSNKSSEKAETSHTTEQNSVDSDGALEDAADSNTTPDTDAEGSTNTDLDTKIIDSPLTPATDATNPQATPETNTEMQQPQNPAESKKIEDLSPTSRESAENISSLLEGSETEAPSSNLGTADMNEIEAEEGELTDDSDHDEIDNGETIKSVPRNGHENTEDDEGEGNDEKANSTLNPAHKGETGIRNRKYWFLLIAGAGIILFAVILGLILSKRKMTKEMQLNKGNKEEKDLDLSQ